MFRTFLNLDIDMKLLTFILAHTHVHSKYSIQSGIYI